MKNISAILTLFATLVVIIVSAFVLAFIWSDLKLPYWQQFQMNNLVDVGVVRVLPICLFVLLILVGFQLLRKPPHNIALAIICIPLSFLLAGLACSSTILVNVFDGDHIYRGDVQFNGRRYFVDSSWKPGVGSVYLSSFWLNECDTEGRNCKMIFEKKYRRIPNNEYKLMKVDLIPDIDAYTITFQINGETVYVHRVE